jgi:predicted secreted protein
MTIFSGIVTFVCIWWTAIFMVLPWGNDPEPGADQAENEFFGKSAPANPRIRKKFMVTTVLSIGIWLAVFALVESNVISFRDIAEGLARQDEIQNGQQN